MWGAVGLGPYIIADAYQDAAIWTVVCIVLLMVGACAARPASDA